MRNFVELGDTVTIPAPANVASGELVKAGLLVGVAGIDALEGEDVPVKMTGVFELAKTNAQAWSVGDPIYMIPSSGSCTTAATAGNVFIGVAAAVAVNPSTTGIVRLNGASPAAAVAG